MDKDTTKWQEAHYEYKNLYSINRPDKKFFTKRMQNELVSTIATKFNRTKLDILEVGCGSGADSICLAVRGHRVVGLDISPHQVKCSRELAKEARNFFPKFTVEFDIGNIFNLHRYYGKYDLVFNFAVIQIWKDKKKRLKALSEMRSTLKKRGYMLIVASNTLNPLYRVIPVRDLITDMAKYNLKLMKNEIEETGFEIKLVDTMGLSETFSQWIKFDLLKYPLVFVNYIFKRLPKKIRLKFAPHILILAQRIEI